MFSWIDDGWMEGWMDGWMDGCKRLFKYCLKRSKSLATGISMFHGEKASIGRVVVTV